MFINLLGVVDLAAPDVAGSRDRKKGQRAAAAAILSCFAVVALLAGCSSAAPSVTPTLGPAKPTEMPSVTATAPRLTPTVPHSTPSAVVTVATQLAASPTAKGTTTAVRSAQPTAYAPAIDPTNFVAGIDNKYLPFKPGTTMIYEGVKDGKPEHNEVQVTTETKKIIGVNCVVVKDTVTVDGMLAEMTLDWYAQDKQGNVWYFGEDAKEYENWAAVSTKGSWEAGVDGAKPGIVMEANPKVEDSYRQEYYKGVAEDMAAVVSLSDSASVPYGSFQNVLVTLEMTPLEPGLEARKSYAPGIGNIQTTEGENNSKLVNITNQ